MLTNVRFAEIAIGIIVGCVPHVHKFFRHFSSKVSMSSSFKILSSNHSGGSSWRKLFGKSSTSEASRSGSGFGSKDPQPGPPYLETLNLTRASFSLTEKELPKPPPPAHHKEVIRTLPLHRMSDQGQKAIMSSNGIKREMPTTPVRANNVEDQALDPVSFWQQHQCAYGNQRNETRRARYDLYPKNQTRS